MFHCYLNFLNLNFFYKILSKISGEYYKNYKINKIKRESNSVKVYYGDRSEFFDYEKIVLAVHADDALSIIENPLKDESEILSNFHYKKNLAVIHTDEISMPKNKKVWSSWNSKIDKKDAKNNTWQGISIKSEEEQATPEFIDIDEN